MPVCVCVRACVRAADFIYSPYPLTHPCTLIKASPPTGPAATATAAVAVATPNRHISLLCSLNFHCFAIGFMAHL